MVQTITQLFNDLAVAPQAGPAAPATFNGTIKANPAVQTFNSPLQMASPASTNPSGYQNFLMGEQIGGSINPGIGTILPGGFISGPSSISQVFNPMPETKLNAGSTSLASPFRNTASTRVIA